MFKNPNISILKEKKLFIFDMDGTILLGGKPFDFAVKFIDNLRAAGKMVLFFTNNASQTTSYYHEKLTRLGFSPSKGEIMTSGDVTYEFLARHRQGKSVYLVGTEALVREYRKKGINLLCGKEESADIVITSFDTTLTYEKLSNACRFVRNGAEYLSTHPDANCPTEDGFIPDSGAISAFVTASTGKEPTYFGKPHKETIEMICEVSAVDRKDMCIFGDRLYTDIALGKRFGVTAALVLSGEAKTGDLINVPKEEYPDFVYPSLLETDKDMFGA